MSALCQDQLSYQIRPKPTLTACVIFPPQHRKESTYSATVQCSVSYVIINNLAYLTCSQITRKKHIRQQRRVNLSMSICVKRDKWLRLDFRCPDLFFLEITSACAFLSLRPEKKNATVTFQWNRKQTQNTP